MESSEGLMGKAVRVAKGAYEKMDRTPQIRFEEVGVKSIGNIVFTQMRNSARRLVGQGRRDNGFYTDDLLRNVKIIPNPDFPSSKYAQVQKKRVEDALNALIESGAIKEVGDIKTNPVPDRYFMVVNEEKLKDIVEGKEIPQTKSA